MRKSMYILLFVGTSVFANEKKELIEEKGELNKGDDCCTKSEGFRDFLADELGVSWDKAVELSNKLYDECIQK